MSVGSRFRFTTLALLLALTAPAPAWAAFNTEVANTISWFYAAAFGRTPIPNSTLTDYGDIGGLTFWTNAYLEGGEGLEQYRGDVYVIADYFVESPEFQAQYPASLSNTAFIIALYDNMLGRAPDDGGLVYWVGRLDAGDSRGTVLADFTNTPENQNSNPLRKEALQSFIGFIAADLEKTITPTEAAGWTAAHPPLDGAIVDRDNTLYKYATDTWKSFKAMTDPDTGLPADHINTIDGVPAAYTSPTNIASYLWSILVVRDLNIITDLEADALISQVLNTLATLERHTDSGQFYNWYNPATGDKLTIWPTNGDRLYPFLSSVDNAWLAAALLMVTRAAPQVRDQAQAILDSMDFSCYYDPDARGTDVGAGLMRGGFWTTEDAPPYAENFPKGNYCGKGPDIIYTGHHYGTLNSETRIVSYLAIALGQVPAAHYFALWRTFPNTCDWSWQEMTAPGITRNYLGIEVYEGYYTYRDQRIVPSWGGSMFEALMPALLMPEAEWGARNWGVNHPLYVQSQIEHGLNEAGYDYWGFSPSQNPDGGYREWGVDPLGMDPSGYTSDQERTTVDYGFRDPSGVGYCPDREPQPLPETYGHGVVTPHAVFLALEFAPQAALENLVRLNQNFSAYAWGGFYDAVGVTTGLVAMNYLALNQGMIMAAISNVLHPNHLKRYFTEGAVEETLRPLLEMEEFGNFEDESVQ